jgi:hypothetical protein
MMPSDGETETTDQCRNDNVVRGGDRHEVCRVCGDMNGVPR